MNENCRVREARTNRAVTSVPVELRCHRRGVDRRRTGRTIDSMLLFSIAVTIIAWLGAFGALAREIWIIHLGP
jgi:hypothetical protein